MGYIFKLTPRLFLFGAFLAYNKISSYIAGMKYRKGNYLGKSLITIAAIVWVAGALTEDKHLTTVSLFFSVPAIIIGIVMPRYSDETAHL